MATALEQAVVSEGGMFVSFQGTTNKGDCSTSNTQSVFCTGDFDVMDQYVAAVAPNSGGRDYPQPFNSMHTPALMTIHGAPG